MAIIVIVLTQQFLRQATTIEETEEIPYSAFEHQVTQKTIAKVIVTDRHILATYKLPHNLSPSAIRTRVRALLDDLEAAVTPRAASRVLLPDASWMMLPVVEYEKVVGNRPRLLQ